MKLFSVFLGAALFTSVLLADTKVKMEDLPAAVQKTVKDQTKSATLVGLSKEVEKGKTMFEVETKVDGKTRDFLVDPNGTIIEVEEEASLDAIPAPAKAAIEKKAAGGKITRVETLTKGSTVSYEAAITTKAGKKIEVGVNADGSVHK